MRILLLRYLFKSRVLATHVIRVDLSKESLQSLKARIVQQPSPSPTLRPWLNALQCIGGLVVILKKNQMQSLMKELCWIQLSVLLWDGKYWEIHPRCREKEILGSGGVRRFYHQHQSFPGERIWSVKTNPSLLVESKHISSWELLLKTELFWGGWFTVGGVIEHIFSWEFF